MPVWLTCAHNHPERVAATLQQGEAVVRDCAAVQTHLNQVRGPAVPSCAVGGGMCGLTGAQALRPLHMAFGVTNRVPFDVGRGPA
jgi:hypothetical protein